MTTPAESSDDPTLHPAPQRLFFALWPTDSVRAALTRVADEAIGRTGGRAVPPDNLHLTLAFLGSIPPERLPAVYAVGDGLKFDPFTLVLNRVEHWVAQSLLCATVDRHPASTGSFVQALNQRMRSVGLVPAYGDWRAHTTLARGVTQRQFSVFIEPIEWQVDAFVLVRSEPSPEGSRYTILKRWPATSLAESPITARAPAPEAR
jgi:2'-5' RNA ligase